MQAPQTPVAHRLCVAPMMDWTDRHCRFFLRQVAPSALLYTEMITTGAILHGDLPRLLDFDSCEHPVALQIGGSEPADLAKAARIGAQWGYDEINLNCGCPSERVQKGAFGACLMREPRLVADGIKAMQDAVTVPVTVKHRIGVDDEDHYGFVRDFVGTLFEAGCRVFIVHARSAILSGLSPKENREVPPLRPEVVRQLKHDFPQAIVVANGGIVSTAQAVELLTAHAGLPAVDGVMLGRAAYHDPWVLHDIEEALALQASSARPQQRTDVLPALQYYFDAQCARGVVARHMTRHALHAFGIAEPDAKSARAAWALWPCIGS